MKKISLESPYREKYRHAYLVVNSENRKMLILFNDSKDRTTTSYARYLLAVKLGRFLTKDEHADHIDDNKNNDIPENLQVLSVRDNIAKGRSRTMVRLTCPVCDVVFIRERRQTHLVKGGKPTCCSIKCARKRQFQRS